MQMARPPESPPSTEGSIDQPESARRRRWLQRGLAAAPVLMTVVSRPVFGQSLACQTMSASMSMPASGHSTVQVCSGLSPEQWKAAPTQWPSPYRGAAPSGGTGTGMFQALAYEQPTAFHCPTTGFGGRVFGNRTMMNVIDMTEGGRNLDTLGRYMVAALLNARSGRTPVLNETGVRNLWNDLINRGYYEPTAGIRWSATEIVAYLKTTMG